MAFRSFSGLARKVAHNEFVADKGNWAMFGLFGTMLSVASYFTYRSLAKPDIKISSATKHNMFDTDSGEENRRYIQTGPYGMLNKRLEKYNNEHGIPNEDRAVAPGR